MILHEVAVEAFRCFRRPYRLAELGPGINLICGPNEAGKSTLFAALAHGLLTPHRSTGRLIEELRPWGTRLSPRVQLLIEVSGRRWRIEKRFLEGRACRLEREDPSGYLPVAEGDAAEERLRQLLGSRPGSRGAGRLAQWAVAELLWVPQGGSGEVPSVGEELRARLQAGAGGIALSARETELLRRLEAAQAALFQEKRGGVRAGTELHRLQRRVEELGAAVSRLEQQRAQLDGLVTELAQAGDGRTELSRHHDELVLEQQRVKGEAAALRQHSEQLERAGAELARARSAFEAVDIFRERLGALQRRMREQDLVIEALTRRQTSLERELDEQLLRYTTQREAATALRAELVRVERREAWERARQEQRGLETRIRRLERLEGEIRALQVEEAAAQPAPSSSALEEAERVWEARAEARAAGTLRLGLQALGPLRIAGAGGATALGAGETLQREGLGALEVELVDVARLRVELAGYDLARAEAAEQAWRKLLAGHQARDLGELRERHLRSEARREALGRLRKEAAGLLGPGERLEDLRIALHALRRRAGGLQGELPISDTTASEPHSGIEEVHRALERNADTLHATQGTLETLRRQATELAVERQGAEVARRAAQADLDEIEARFGSTDELLASWREARQLFDMAVDRAADLKGAGPAAGADPDRALARVELELQGLAVKERELRDRQVSAETRVQDAGSAGLYEQLVSAREELARAERDLGRASRRARATRLLASLGRQLHGELSSGLARPLAQELSACLERVSGRAGRQVLMQDDLALRGLLIPAEEGDQGGASADLTALSGGTQEQLALLYRLALGRLLAGSERMTVVLDDPLADTDPGRQARLLDLLDGESQRLQILILTCQPDRYAALPTRRVFELPPF